MRRSPRRAASLVTTLFVLVVLSTIVVAFLQSMSIDRLTAKSARNTLQTELAARAGFSSAIAQILMATGTNNAFVTGSTNYAADHGALVTIGRSNLVDAAQLMPLVSMPPELLSSFLQPEWSNSLSRVFSELPGTNSIDINARSAIIQSTTNNKFYRAPWVVMRNSSGERSGRFAYLVLDENSRVNPFAHSGSGSLANPTNWYSGPGDISLTNASAVILTPAEQTAILTAGHLLTPESLAQAFPSRKDYDRVRHLLTVQTNETYDVIPAIKRFDSLSEIEWM
jgi:hypothetical protein